jgi:hypothetical protein
LTAAARQKSSRALRSNAAIWMLCSVVCVEIIPFPRFSAFPISSFVKKNFYALILPSE